MPALDLFQRFTDPYRRYRRELGHELQPQLLVDGLVVLGLNTARADTRKSGRLNSSQLATLERTVSSASPEALRVLVTHHPFVAPPQRPDASVVGRMSLALPSLERAHVDLLLSGHRHVRHTHLLPVREAAAPRSLLVLLAGTACSRRHRGETNSYNLVTGDRESLTVTVREWTGERFVAGVTRGYLRREGRWEEESPPPPERLARGDV